MKTIQLLLIFGAAIILLFTFFALLSLDNQLKKVEITQDDVDCQVVGQYTMCCTHDNSFCFNANTTNYLEIGYYEKVIEK